MSLKKKIIKGAKNKMSLVDILEGTAKLLGAGVIIYGLNELRKQYIPWAEKLQEAYDKEEKECTDDYRFSDEK